MQPVPAPHRLGQARPRMQVLRTPSVTQNNTWFFTVFRCPEGKTTKGSGATACIPKRTNTQQESNLNACRKCATLYEQRAECTRNQCKGCSGCMMRQRLGENIACNNVCQGH